MVLILEGNSEHVTQACWKNRSFLENNIKFATNGINKCLKKIKLLFSLNTYATFSLFLSNKVTTEQPKTQLL